MCNNNNNNQNTCENCMADILKVILLLQDNVCGNDSCLETCDRGFLGQNIQAFFNTRPIVLYLVGTSNTPLEMPISKDPTETTTSTVFRIEKLNNCCATFRVLAPSAEGSQYPYTTTNSFFTINLNYLCCIRCLDDTYIDVQ